MDIVQLALKFKNCEEIKTAVQQQTVNSMEGLQKLLDIVKEKQLLKQEELQRKQQIKDKEEELKAKSKAKEEIKQ